MRARWLRLPRPLPSNFDRKGLIVGLKEYNYKGSTYQFDDGDVPEGAELVTKSVKPANKGRKPANKSGKPSAAEKKAAAEAAAAEAKAKADAEAAAKAEAEAKAQADADAAAGDGDGGSVEDASDPGASE